MTDGDAMKKSDLTVEILKDIRQELRHTNTRLDAVVSSVNSRFDETNSRLDETNSRLDETNARLEGLTRRVVESEVRIATAVTDLAHNVHDLTAYLRAQGDLRPRVERCERDIADLQTKLRPAS